MYNGDVEVITSPQGRECPANGEHEGIEIQCDECNHYFSCYPEDFKPYSPKLRARDTEFTAGELELMRQALAGLPQGDTEQERERLAALTAKVNRLSLAATAAALQGRNSTRQEGGRLLWANSARVPEK